MTGEAATAMVAEAVVTVEVAAVTAEAVFVRLKEVLVAFLFEVFLLLECAHPFPARVPFP